MSRKILVASAPPLMESQVTAALFAFTIAKKWAFPSSFYIFVTNELAAGWPSESMCTFVQDRGGLAYFKPRMLSNSSKFSLSSTQGWSSVGVFGLSTE